MQHPRAGGAAGMHREGLEALALAARPHFRAGGSPGEAATKKKKGASSAGSAMLAQLPHQLVLS